MAQLPFTRHRGVPYIVGGLSGVHVLARMWRLSRMPARDLALHMFLLKHSDVVLVLGSGPVIVWYLAKRHQQPSSPGQPYRYTTNGADRHGTRETLISSVAHELRQVFTALLLGLGLIVRKAKTGNSREIPRLARRLNTVVSQGIDAVNVLDPPSPDADRERALEA